MPHSCVVHHEAAAASFDHACAIRDDGMQLWHSHLQGAGDSVVFSQQALAVSMSVECTRVSSLAGMHTNLSGTSTHCFSDYRKQGTCRFMCVFQHRAGW